MLIKQAREQVIREYRNINKDKFYLCLSNNNSPATIIAKEWNSNEYNVLLLGRKMTAHNGWASPFKNLDEINLIFEIHMFDTIEEMIEYAFKIAPTKRGIII